MIIPVRDGLATLPRCLQALRPEHQDFDSEIIVVDDCSRDGSGEAAEDQGAQVIRFKEPGGPSVARNRGAETARGSILVFIDADVELPRGALRLIKSILDRYPQASGVQGTYLAAIPHANPASYFMHLEVLFYIHETLVKPGDPWARETGTFCLAIRREAFSQVGGFDEAFTFPNFEDREMGARLSRKGIRIRFDPELKVTHWKREKNIFGLLKKTLVKAWRNTHPRILKLRFRQDFMHDVNRAFHRTFYLRTLLAPLLVLFPALALAGHSWSWWPLAAVLAGHLASLAGLLRFSMRLRGVPLTLGYLLYSFPQHLIIFVGGLSGTIFHLLWRKS